MKKFLSITLAALMLASILCLPVFAADASADVYVTIADKDGNLVSGARVKANYIGFTDCLSASNVGGSGPLSCKYGCLGFGTCVKACKYDAIKIEKNLAVIDYSLCTSCGLCAAVCPKKLIASPVDTPEEVLQIVKEHMKNAKAK